MPKISVIIAAYNTPQSGLLRALHSLEAQTMPTSEFEVIIVDDGSSDDTYERLTELAQTRSWLTVYTIQNSGWASAPRNHGIERATGEYFLFMDHDDTLFPEALQAMWDYASAHNSDLLSPKESKTNDTWWGLEALLDGNRENVMDEHGIELIIPMVPHKLYRRELFTENGVRFPTGGRVLWEDQFLNIAAYRHSKVVSVLADTPTYLWHASDTNTSHTFQPSREDFWVMLDRLMDFTVSTLDGEEFAPELEKLLTFQTRVRIIDRMVRLLASDESAQAKERGLRSAQAILAKYVTDAARAKLPLRHAVMAELLEQGRDELLVEFHRSDTGRKMAVTADSLQWDGQTLRVGLELRWFPARAGSVGFELRDGRVFLGVSAGVEQALPAGTFDVTDRLSEVSLIVALRSRTTPVSWTVPVTVGPMEYREVEGVGELVGQAVVEIDIDRAACGAPLDPEVWDLRWQLTMFGMVRLGAVRYGGPIRPALVSGRALTAYSSNKGTFAMDMSGTLRTVAVDAKPRHGAAAVDGVLSIPLGDAHVHGATRIPAEVKLVPIGGFMRDKTIDLVLVGDEHGARLEASGPLSRGRYRFVADRDGKKKPYVVIVASDGSGTVEKVPG